MLENKILSYILLCSIAVKLFALYELSQLAYSGTTCIRDTYCLLLTAGYSVHVSDWNKNINLYIIGFSHKTSSYYLPKLLIYAIFPQINLKQLE